MLRESLLAILEKESGVEVWAIEPDPFELLVAVERHGADVVVVTLPGSGDDPGIGSHLLLEYPQLLVVALEPETGGGFTYRLVIAKEEIGHLDSEGLLALVRGHRASPALLPLEHHTPRDAGRR